MLLNKNFCRDRLLFFGNPYTKMSFTVISIISPSDEWPDNSKINNAQQVVRTLVPSGMNVNLHYVESEILMFLYHSAG